MARNGKAISVKIATTKVIKALETRLAELEANYKKQDENEAKFQKSIEKWKKEVAKFATANISKAENIRTNYRSWNKTLNVDFDLTLNEEDFPKQPERDFEQIHQHSYNEMKEEISNALRILKMTDEEVVSTSTYNAVARYL
jgi:septal ring factor EnvC (AmiA/AmiB activator)